MSGIFSGVIGEYEDGSGMMELGWYARDVTLVLNNEYYYSAAENVSILAGILVVGSGTFAENVNATGVTWSKTDSEGITSHFYQSGTISIASGGSARNVTLGTFGAAQNAGVIEHLSVHSGGLYGGLGGGFLSSVGPDNGRA